MSSSLLLSPWHRGFRHGRLLLLSSRRARWFSSDDRISRSLRESYRVLQLPAEGRSSPAEVRAAYLRLAKLYHPDCGEPTADAGLFALVEEAYRAVLAHQSKTRQPDGATEDDEDKSRGNALQHRHYLSYEGVGSGAPSQRERQYRQVRVDRAAEQVLSYRQREHERAAAADGAMAERDARQRSHKIKITQAVERLVEDLIQESMARGDFRNLSGAGKPLNKFQHNPYADPMTHNLNRILIDNGYQPPWVVTQRDIREGAARVRSRLLEGLARLGDPMTPAERRHWERLCGAVEEELAKLNKMVDDYNLIVPMLGMQMVHFSLAREAARAQRVAEQRRAELLQVRQEERERRKEEKKRANSANRTPTKRRGLVSWMQSLLGY
ncbi:dnaJ homolog subfamily C member 28 [Xiphophorus hellerii]|uniref:dnaJ homolog subfamily C member 28 n=1 Tax=Xiphophorus hellerii TaxID=8084 RepID=UPI0013B37286|nr:dnaJ homolog subfamily C member 28 [Xiphophorus hellerii]XP_032415033.1 dnaJ homolog subfamily C member 28 [Xiphophorus hellerii]XP_032415034.1 dnaJ homolog subfamily C member 28 [Xiphophorus hellerii]XP_032415035.1 dnaJ homolog subfamily C member 28 [Xiphophorus hellerii]XP_032415036.1 dnaJ homolog subfamily C member 28 [Xiphophorus hellerii]XP_032415037.1 dnaJ homolog subfamily C member 28 [Xiphophorus hellerii]